MTRLKSLIVAGLMVLGSLGGVMATSDIAEAAVTCPDGSYRKENGIPANSLAECNLPAEQSGDGLMNRVSNIISVVLGVLGLVAVVVIIIGGISFITSQGDSSKVTKARNTILYGVVGLVIALLAYAIVNFVLKGVFGGASTS